MSREDLPDETIPATQQPRRILVLGATGYVGGRLVPRLIQAGHTVSVAVRSPEKLESVPWCDE
ncbi:NmrA family NAD(P)-binding protein, partial [Brevibacterium aurantiacum]